MEFMLAITEKMFTIKISIGYIILKKQKEKRDKNKNKNFYLKKKKF
jgi:hypothetical protein